MDNYNDTLCISDIETIEIDTTKLRNRTRKILIFICCITLYTTTISTIILSKSIGSPRLITYLNNYSGSTEMIFPYGNPRVTDKQALLWARDRACELLSLSFIDYENEIRQRKEYFIGDGWIKYQLSLLDNAVIQNIKKEALIITAINEYKPRLIQRYYLNGKINWRIEMPLLQTIQGASDKQSTNKKIVSITIQETTRDESVDSLKIRTFGVM